MSTNKIDEMTEREAKHLLNDIANVFSIGGEARTASIILTNVKNANNDEFCRHKRVVEFLEGKAFRFIKKSNGYLFTSTGAKIDSFGKNIMDAVETAIEHEEAHDL